MILPLLIIVFALVPMDLSRGDFVFAQSGNSLAQEGDDNGASQSDPSSQKAEQDTMCISGETTSLSCNNLTSENIDSQDRDDEQRPMSIQGKIYQKLNTGGSLSSSLFC